MYSAVILSTAPPYINLQQTTPPSSTSSSPSSFLFKSDPNFAFPITISKHRSANMIDLKSEKAHMQLVEHVEDEDDCFEAIDKLIAQGINAGDIKKLQDAGIHTCNGLMMQTKKSLTGIKGLSEAKIDKICEAAEKIINFGYITGSDVLLRRRNVVKITTGSPALDELLGGGIETSSITEAFGKFRSGKTQLAHTLCVSTQLPLSMHGGNGKVAYIDTEGAFGPDRIVLIAERFGLDSEAALENIIYARAYTYEHQYNLLGLAAKMSEEPFRLLLRSFYPYSIIDSIIALLRVDFSGGGELAEHQRRLTQMLSRIIKIAEEFNVAVYMTNQGFADPGDSVLISHWEKLARGELAQAPRVWPVLQVDQTAIDFDISLDTCIRTVQNGESSSSAATTIEIGESSSSAAKPVKFPESPCFSDPLKGGSLFRYVVGREIGGGRGYLPPLFIEHACNGRKAVFDLESGRWKVNPFVLRLGRVNASNPRLRFIIANNHLDYSLNPLNDEWHTINGFDNKKFHVVVTRAMGFLVVFCAGELTRLYDLRVPGGVPAFFAEVPDVYSHDKLEFHRCIHAISSEKHVFVMGNRSNELAVFGIESRAWLIRRWYDNGPDSWLTLAGFICDKIILVGSYVVYWDRVPKSIWEIDLDDQGLPGTECRVVCDMPDEYRDLFGNEIHEEDEIRMVNEYVCFYSNPFLVVYNFIEQEWSCAVHPDDGVHFAMSSALSVLERRF